MRYDDPKHMWENSRGGAVPFSSDENVPTHRSGDP